jgi:predicted nucleic acid-binding Zn ribbon protein
VEIRCGVCSNVVPADALRCPACGRNLGSAAPRQRPPGLLIWAAVAAAVEVALTLVLIRACR